MQMTGSDGNHTGSDWDHTGTITEPVLGSNWDARPDCPFPGRRVPSRTPGLALTLRWTRPHHTPPQAHPPTGWVPHPPSPRPRARKHRPGQRALQEIRRYQSSTRLLLRPGPFACLVRELCLRFSRGVDHRWQRVALLALQEAAETFMVWLLEDAYLCSLHARRAALFPMDVQLAWCLQGPEAGASE
ncbi:histone H3-like centromeric protein A [Motacilla alba alba]|uniref:histone H3-like centromeric protein A n=1 Tax=Motacilla alba alba TaxID=1094192 RepID=UPI0018D5A004|nr:histone H3-like centromeric protein A [Motacilla alba alba]